MAEEDDRRFNERMERREALEQQGEQQRIAPTPRGLLATRQVLRALQAKVDAFESAKAAFDSIDENKSGRVSADELAVALKAMQVSVSEKKAEEIIREINERFGSKRKALTLEIFVQAFKKGASHGGNLVQRL